MRVLLLVPAATLLLSSAPAQPDVVEYACKVRATGQTQDVKVEVELTVPTDAQVGEEMAIGWQGSYVEGSELRAPTTGLGDDLNLYAYAGISGIDKLTSATGVAAIGPIIPGAPVPLPATTVNLKTRSKNPGTGTVHAASINFGTSSSDRAIECEVKDKDALTKHPLTIPGTGDTTSPSDSASESPSDSPSPGETETKTRTPAGAADTGGGGEAGPDGRVLVGVGSLLVLASVTGLVLRRRRLVAGL
ncbi:hypothetical protein ACFPOI_00795 [Nonomuraea angiospora]|uniref:Peptidase n=1 Tax=Nonomuraea angiospora TaxID=46172 RepID=A0ABR9M202_9ACTN|nr:hypothetical protein [Nonomuraea angiospora]MBE1586941.1 hypothetical protein [Nonomuraea angiospora]